MINPMSTPPPVIKSGLRAKLRLFILLIVITGCFVPLLLILLAAVNISDTIQCSGTVVPEYTYDITPSFDGRVVKVFFHTGDSVKQGDLLVQMDDSDYVNEARVVESQIAILKAQLQVKKSELEVLKVEPLPENYRHADSRLAAAKEAYHGALENINRYKDVIIPIDFIKYEKEAREAKVALAICEENARIVHSGYADKILQKAMHDIAVTEQEIAQKYVALDLTRQKIKDCRICAIEAGTVLVIPCKRPMFAKRGEPAVTIGCGDLMVRAEVDSHFIRKVRNEQNASISSDIFSKLQYGTFSAVVEKIGEVPLEQDGTACYPVYLRLNTEDCDIKIGSKAEVKIFTGSSPALYAFLNLTKDDETAQRLQALRKKNAQAKKAEIRKETMQNEQGDASGPGSR